MSFARLLPAIGLFSIYLARGSTSDLQSNYNPDISINRKIFLEDYKSGDSFYHCLVVDNGFRMTPFSLYKSLDSKQYLVCYQYEGGTKHAYSLFEFGYSDKEVSRQSPCATGEKSFSTESGLKLGLSYLDVIKLKGIPYKFVKGPNAVIEYKVAGQNSSFLKKYNMPGYSMTVYFKNSLVNKVKFGFDYP